MILVWNWLVPVLNESLEHVVFKTPNFQICAIGPLKPEVLASKVKERFLGHPVYVPSVPCMLFLPYLWPQYSSRYLWFNSPAPQASSRHSSGENNFLKYCQQLLWTLKNLFPVTNLFIQSICMIWKGPQIGNPYLILSSFSTTGWKDATKSVERIIW